MAKIKYYYDKNSLSYKRIKLSPLTKLKKIIYFSSLVALSSFLLIVIFLISLIVLKKKIEVRNS